MDRGYQDHSRFDEWIDEGKILNLSKQAVIFDKMRRIRNGINYYGGKVSEDNAGQIISDLNSLIKWIKEILA